MRKHISHLLEWAYGHRGHSGSGERLMQSLALLLLKGAWNTREVARSAVMGIRYYGKGRWCPVCGRSSREFCRFGRPPREDAQCARCRALERHRLVWLYFDKMTDLFDNRPKTMLHVAPELCFKNRLKKRLGGGYITADLADPRVMVRMDITQIPYPDQSFDVVYCSHVLEHVQDDRRAMREIHRVLKKDGWAILLVPITADKTFEDPAIVDASDRLRYFLQEDHVRQYGPDFADRLREAGFEVKIAYPSDVTDNATYMGLTAASGEIYYCTKA